jgi:uncharacterized membrane protein YeaQ/YmgE (transglycosylase-associated protein family)
VSNKEEIYMDLITTIISLISGAVGGNLAGSAMSQKNLGPIVNTIAGLVGGGAGEFILQAFGIITAASGAAGGGGFDLTQIISSVAAGGVGGGALTAIITAIKDAVQKKSL